MEDQRTRSIGYLLFDGIQALDLFGPLEAFQEANELSARGRACYENILLSADGGPVSTSSGARILAHCALEDGPPLDTLIIPGGEGARRESFPDGAIAWIQGADTRTRRTGSICTGLFVLAQTGLLKGRTVTTHWRHAGEAEARFPDLIFSSETLYCRDGKYFTAAGVTAGIDLALALIDDDYGPDLAKQVARNLVVFFRRPGDQRQFSTPLKAQMAVGHDFADLVAWIADHLDQDLDAFALADRVGLSERQFRRRFARALGETPVRYVERVRLEAVAERLANSVAPIQVIAHGTGFSGPDVLRRAFERHYGISPSQYRARFQGVDAGSLKTCEET
ncbi:MAG: GlxA family transcriptional regulator [Alphaproteobacteria bacterium]